ERDEVEGGVLEGEPRRVTDFEPHSAAEIRRRLPARLRDHRLGEVDADDLRVREAPRDRERTGSGSRPEVEGAPRWLGQSVETTLERLEAARSAPSVPRRREQLELAPEGPAEEAPERRPADDR